MEESNKMSQTSLFKPSRIIFRNHAPKIASIALIVMLFVSSFSIPSSSAQVMQENDCAPPLTTTIDSNYQGPVAVDAYWVDQGVVDTSASATNPIKKEVGPGEGTEVFAVVLNNRGDNPLNSVTAYLNLPSGFVATGESKIPQLLEQYNPASKVATSNFALASYYGQVAAGGTFILFFDVDVLNSAKVGTYGTTMVVNYKIGVGAASLNIQSCTSALLEVPFVLPGKVIMDVSTVTNTIAPSRADPISITVLNKGSAPATGVVATITNLGQKGNSGSGSSGTLTLSSTTTNIVNLGPNQFNLGDIPANGSVQIHTTVFPSTSAAGQTQDVSILLTYENAWGKQLTTQLDSGIVVTPMPPQSLSLTYAGNDTSPVITSGNVSPLNFIVSNNGTNEATNVVISLVPENTSASSVSVVGQSTWTIPKLEPGEKQVLSTSVFAADALIDTPTSFTLTANYVSRGQTETNSLTLGAFVIGNIQLQLYGLTVNYVGSTPNLAGSLLNQGSTTGLYTTVQLYKSPILQDIREARITNATGNGTGNSSTKYQAGGFGSTGGSGYTHHGGGMVGGSQAMTPQFLGDLTPDSPIPFSIPLSGISYLQPGSYPVSFKVVYADDLKSQHTLVLNGTVFVGRAPQTNAGQHKSILDQFPISLPALIGIIIAAIAGVIVARRIKSKKQKMKMLTGSDTDIVAALDGSDKE